MPSARPDPVRVAMVGLRAPWHTAGGVEAAVGALAPRLARRGCQVTVYCRRRYNRLGPGMHQGVRLVDVDTAYSPHMEAILHTALATPRACARHELVHIHATGPALLSWLPRLAGRKCVVTVHGLDWQRDKWGGLASTVLRAGAWSAARFPDGLIGVGAHLQDHFSQAYGRRLNVIPNGVEPIAAVPLAEAGVPRLKSQGYLVFVGRLVPEKNIEALASVWRGAHPGVDLVVVGDSGHTDAYAAALRSQAPAGVHFVGRKMGRARDALLTHAAGFVSASKLEGLPLAPLEAMAAGLPVLLSDIPPHREVAGDVGVLVGPQDWPAAIARLMARTPQARGNLGRAGQEWVAAAFSWDEAADRTLALYRQVLAG